MTLTKFEVNKVTRSISKENTIIVGLVPERIEFKSDNNKNYEPIVGNNYNLKKELRFFEVSFSAGKDVSFFISLLGLKEIIKGSNKWDFVYDLDFNNILVDESQNILCFKENFYLDFNKLSIDPYEFPDGSPPFIIKDSNNIEINFSPQRNLLTRFITICEGFINSDANKENEDLLSVVEGIKNTEGFNELEEFCQATQHTDPDRYVIFNLKSPVGNKKISEEIKPIFEFLEAAEIWLDLGVKKQLDLGRILENGFNISNSDFFAQILPCSIGIRDSDGNPILGFGDLKNPSNVAAIKNILKDLKYRGFPIFESTQEKNSLGALEASQSYTKDRIDNFWRRMKFSGLNENDVIPVEDPKQGSGLPSPYDEETDVDPKNHLGFHPRDLEEGYSSYRSDGNINSGLQFILTKVCFDIILAENYRTAIDLAFFGIDYEAGANGKTPNPNLQLNEVNFFYDFSVENGNLKDSSSLIIDSSSRTQILELYYKVMQLYLHCQWNGDKYDNAGVKQEIDNAYNYAREFAEVWDRWMADTLPTDEATKNADIAYLQGIISNNSDPFAIKIKEKWNNVVIFLLNKATVNPIFSQIQAAQSAETDTTHAQKVYNSNEIITEEILNEIKILLPLIKDAEKDNPQPDTYEKLKVFVDDSQAASPSYKGVAWNIAIQVELQSDINKSWANEAWEKIKVKLQDQEKAAKNKIGDENIAQTILNDLTNFTDIKNASEIFIKAKGILTDNNANLTDLRDKINNLKSASGKAWDAVNNYKGANNEYANGYAQAALDKVGQQTQEFKEITAQLVEIKDKDQLETEIDEKINNATSDDIKNKLNEIKPWIIAAAEKDAEEASSATKNLIQLIRNSVSSQWIDDFQKKDETEIKKLAQGFKKYVEATKGSPEKTAYEELKTTTDAIFNKIKQKMKSLGIKENTPQQNNEKTPGKGLPKWGIVLIIGSVLTLVAVAIWFFNRNDGEEEED